MRPLLQNQFLSLLLLIFFVATLTSSKYIIIHDETLVVLCFVSFIIFIYVLLKDITVSLFNERAGLIEKEFNDSYKLKEQTLEVLVSYHAKQVSLLNEINDILLFTKNELSHVIKTRQAALRVRLINEIRNKLNLAIKKEDAFFHFVQQNTNNIVMNNILDTFRSMEGPALKDQCFDEGIRIIEQAKNT